MLQPRMLKTRAHSAFGNGPEHRQEQKQGQKSLWKRPCNGTLVQLLSSSLNFLPVLTNEMLPERLERAAVLIADAALRLVH
jgi:hypothetical protein